MAKQLGLTKQDRINTVFTGGGHVVILGAGASIAATLRNPLPNGQLLPSMDTLIDVVGLNPFRELVPENLYSKNFETFYSNLVNDGGYQNVIDKMENCIYEYFKSMTLPDVPTIYDYLVLALRSRDIIATFNWDPLLYKAWSRNGHIKERPYIAFLHGNVALGYSEVEKRAGPARMWSKATNEYFEPSRLLYPVTKKNYSDDPFIKSQWDMLESFLSDKVVRRLTIFGYGAPASDTDAVEIMNKAWGTGKTRRDEQFEIIDIRPEEDVMNQWKNFIYHGHTDYTTDYFQSSLAWNPRRTFESYQHHNFPMTEDEAFSAANPVPNHFKTLQELWEWHKPLVEAEERKKKESEVKGK